MSPTLEEATAKQLITELFNRYEAACFLGVRNTRNADVKAFHVGHRGPDEFAIGLLNSYARKLEVKVSDGWETPLEDSQEFDG